MPNLKDIRKRVATVKSTQQITKAMKMVAAAKLRRAQEAAESARLYAEKLGALVHNLAAGVEGTPHPFLGEGSGGPAHLIVLTSDRGLCGGYNANIIKMAERFLAGDEGQEATLTACGRRGFDYFHKRIDERITADHINLPGGLDLELARRVAAEGSERFLSGASGSVHIVYAQFQSAMTQVPVVERLLPIGADDADSLEIAPDYLYEPDRGSLLSSLVARYLETRIFQAMLEATASEHGSRMTAMDSATRNASDMIESLTLAMNRARQAAITTELMEIVGGAEALNG